MTDKYLPCPFCGDRDIRSRHVGHAGGWVIECHSCPCELSFFSSETESWAAWNKRPSHEPSGQLRASEWAEANNAAVTKEWMRGWDACLVANRIPLTTGSLLRPASTQAPPGCHCQTHCAAPVVMGRQTPCRDPQKASAFARTAQKSSEGHRDPELARENVVAPYQDVPLMERSERAIKKPLTPNDCPKCVGLGYCRCEIASNE